MKGLAKGEQSTLANPRLQLIARSGGFLVDIYSGSYVIQDIRTGDPAEKVASQTIHTTNDRVGKGRYALKTGATADWSLGTHRAIVTFQLSASGSSHTQVVEFEILDPADWVTGQGYIGYISTRKMLLDNITTLPKMSVQDMHRMIREYSQLITQWTGRMGFHPIYTTLKVDGSGTLQLLLDEAIIALDKITDEEGTEYDATAYQVFNRHLNNGPDDRYNPKVSRTDELWPEGRQNVWIAGVFGFTDPEPAEDTSEQVSIGYTPEELGRIIGVLINRRIEDPQLTDPTVASPGSVRSMRTRDQAITLGGAAASSDGQGSMTGDPLLDQLLVRFARPVYAAYAGRGPEVNENPWPWP